MQTHCTYVFYFMDKPAGVGVASKAAYTKDQLKYALIVPWLNPCCCVPCLPAWCPVPWGRYGMTFTMEEHADSNDGAWWHRRSSLCGYESTSAGAYELVRVLNKDGSETSTPWGGKHLQAFLAAQPAPSYFTMMR